jgi:hypothetical protein
MQPGIGIGDGAAVHLRDSRVTVVQARAGADAHAVSVRDGCAAETLLEGERVRIGAG